MNPITVLGANGQVGRSLVEAATARGIPVRAVTRDACDVTDPAALARVTEGASLLVNCTAYTAVDKAESEAELAFAVNATAPEQMARVCAAQGVPLVHISTDYVFDGSGDRPWREDDLTAPLGVYGRSKLAGETAVAEQLDRHVILRTSWVFSAYGANFVKTMRRLGATRPELTVVDDQRGGPTAAADIAAAILTIAERLRDGSTAWGTYHFSGAPATTWCGFAKAILADVQSVTVRPIPTSAYPTPAQRPLNSVLDCTKIERAFGIPQPDWRPALEAVLARLKNEAA
ncbi:MAG TPA: dTDP-4-dehydrorhamnose reductase [Beijerinckiaceae bacterium]|jgi:dTDP-4-dehydrorhamnose reductase